MKPVPTHHIQDVEDAVALAIDTIEYGVGVPPVLIPVSAWQVAGETFDLLPTFAKHLRGPISGNHEVPAALRRQNLFLSGEIIEANKPRDRESVTTCPPGQQGPPPTTRTASTGSCRFYAAFSVLSRK